MKHTLLLTSFNFDKMSKAKPSASPRFVPTSKEHISHIRHTSNNYELIKKLGSIFKTTAVSVFGSVSLKNLGFGLELAFCFL